MSLTIDEIVEYQDRLRREIVERECLLAAFNVLHGYVANDRAPKSLELGSLVSALTPSATAGSLPERAAELSSAPAAAALPPPPPVPAYMHPELRALSSYGHGSNGRIVAWAISQMNEDYSLRDLAALLQREGCSLRSADISVVLTRLKSRGEIEEIKCGAGPKPAVYRRPESATAPLMETADEIEGAATPVESSAAA